MIRIYLHTCTSVIIHGQGFCSTFSFIIATPLTYKKISAIRDQPLVHISHELRSKYRILQLTDWVHVSPIRLLLWMLKGISIDFTCAGEQKSCPNSLCKTQHIESAHYICLVKPSLRISKYKSAHCLNGSISSRKIIRSVRDF